MFGGEEWMEALGRVSISQSHDSSTPCSAQQDRADKSPQCPIPHLEIGHQENYTGFAEATDSWLV